VEGMMANISERPVDSKILPSIKACAVDGLRLLGLGEESDPQTVVEAVDEFAYQWQKGKRPSKEILDPEDAPFTMGSLWGDRSLVIYPIHFLLGCFRSAGVDCTVALSFNMLGAREFGQTKPKEYLNVMECVHRIVPRK
jgi:hypothetical protein